jgi:drug/metabolite transporter (DMT)-like permease
MLLAMRVVQGLLMMGCLYTAVRELPLAYVALISNLGPLFTALFSYLWVRSSVSRLDLYVLGISFVGVAMLITGSTANNQEAKNTLRQESSKSLVLPIICVLMVPILTGTLAIT